MTSPRLFGPETIANPYPLYHSLRATQPVYWAEGIDGWLVTRYDDVSAALRNPKFSATGRNELMRRKITDPQMLAPVLEGSQNMLFTDPPAHTRMRSLVSKAFTPGAVEAMADRIRELVDEFLTAAQRRGRMEVIADLAYPLPVTVICDMLGLPAQDRAQFKSWSNAIAAFVNTAGDMTPEVVRAGVQARLEFVKYLRGIVAQRRQQPRDDLITALMQAHEGADRLSELELYSNGVLLLIAGNETTTNLIGTAILNLLQNPDQLNLLRSDARLLGNAVEELLRFDSPVQLITRIALEDVTLGGTLIHKGQILWLVLGAANHDSEHYADPDRVDIRRENINHLAFGAGMHFCLGAPLARLETQIAIDGIVRRFPNLRLPKQELRYLDNYTLRGLQSLQVEF